MPKLIIQTDDSSCGHCCIAMAAGVSLASVRRYIGCPDGLTTADMRKALAHFGLSTSRRMHPVGERGLGRIHTGRAILHTVQRVKPLPAYGHWALLWDGGIFDPGGAYTALYYPTTIVSYLRIHKLEGAKLDNDD